MADMKKKLTQEDLEKVVGGANLEFVTRPVDDPEEDDGSTFLVDVYLDGVFQETSVYHDQEELRHYQYCWYCKVNGIDD